MLYFRPVVDKLQHIVDGIKGVKCAAVPERLWLPSLSESLQESDEV